MKSAKFFYGALFLASICCSSAHAFHISEHERITARAVDGLQKCGLLPADWDLGWKRIISDGNASEDTDLIRKWSRYSHYFNPHHKIDQRREDSSVTIRESVAEIAADPKDELGMMRLVGRIVHHVQDAAVPAHVIPVNHFADDGFEKMDISQFYTEPQRIEDCGDLAPGEPDALLQQTALATLANLRGAVSFSVEGFHKNKAWLDSFWTLSRDNGFGSYGSLGNSFGAEEFSLEDGRTVRVPRDQYDWFKRFQVALAVRATQNAILWANRLRGL